MQNRVRRRDARAAAFRIMNAAHSEDKGNLAVVASARVPFGRLVGRGVIDGGFWRGRLV